MPEPSAVPAERFEWERLVRRITMPRPVKLVALVLATYADFDGTRVRPGADVVAAVTGYSKKQAQRLISTLQEMGLLTLTKRGGGRGGSGKASEYRLTAPVDLLDRFELLGPGDRPEPEDTQMSSQSPESTVDNPVDNPESGDTQMSPQFSRDRPNERTSSDPSKPIERTFSANERTSRCPTTNHYTNHKETNPVVTTQGESRPRARQQPILIPIRSEAS